MRGTLGRWRGGAVYLALCGAISALVYAAILARLPLERVYTTPLLNLNHIKASDWPTGATVIACVALLFAAYAIGALVLARESWDVHGAVNAPSIPSLKPLVAMALLGFPLVFAALLIFTHPMTSTDVYDYLFRGRMLARYQANPFVDIPWKFRVDPLIRYVAWKLAVTAYGPLWEGMSWATARLAGEAPGRSGAQLLTLMLAYKGLAALGFLLCGGAIWLALRGAAPKWRWLGLYLWLWNPLALWETVGAGHNDVWMALCIVLAIAALGRRHEAIGDRQIDHYLSPIAERLSPLAALLALTAGGLIKYVAFFFGPVALAAALRRMAGWRARLGLFVAGGLSCAGLVTLAYAPFWAGWSTLENVRDRRDLYTASWLGVLRVVLKRSMPEDRAATIVAAAGLALLFAGVLWACWRAWRDPARLAEIMLWLALWFLLLCNPWFQPWYVVWPLALVVVQPWRARAVVAVAVLCVAALVGYVVGGLALPALGMADKSLGREAWMAALVTVPPLLVLGWPHVTAGWRALRRTSPRRAASGTRRAAGGERRAARSEGTQRG